MKKNIIIAICLVKSGFIYGQLSINSDNYTNARISVGAQSYWAPITIYSRANTTKNEGVALALEGTNFPDIGFRFRANGSNYYQVLYDGSAINWKHYEGGNYIPKLSLTNSGFLGVGITNPDTKLHIEGTTSTYSRIANSGGNTRLTLGAVTDRNIIYSQDYNGGAQTLKLQVNNENNFVIRPDGKIGIGTADPSAELEVKSDTNDNAEIHINSSTSGKPSILRFQDAGITTWGLLSHYPNPDKLSIYNYHNNTNAMVFDINGNVGIGTNNPNSNYKLSVNGSIRSKEVKVEANWSDFVFEPDYDLLTLEEVEQHIQEKGHLPEIPNEADVTENGFNLGEMNAKLLQKVEELTLYLIEQNKQNQSQQARIEQLEKKLAQLEER
ncbi:hypothetical protein [Marinoscillum sp.]|uniref:hypothetical protein n=1 Tax=Marinoscillum sp. TaxID=2024838 RepID=UPI003BA9C66A